MNGRIFALLIFLTGYSEPAGRLDIRGVRQKHIQRLPVRPERLPGYPRRDNEPGQHHHSTRRGVQRQPLQLCAYFLAQWEPNRPARGDRHTEPAGSDRSERDGDHLPDDSGLLRAGAVYNCHAAAIRGATTANPYVTIYATLNDTANPLKARAGRWRC